MDRIGVLSIFRACGKRFALISPTAVVADVELLNKILGFSLINHFKCL